MLSVAWRGAAQLGELMQINFRATFEKKIAHALKTVYNMQVHKCLINVGVLWHTPHQ